MTFENNLSFFEDDKFFWATLNSINRVVRYHEEKYHITISRNGLTGSACNEKRVRAVRVWKEIADQCEDILPIYEDASHGQLAYQCFILLLAMYRADYRDIAVEKAIQKTMVVYRKLGIKHVNGMAHKMFYYLALVHVGLARWLFGMLVTKN